MATKRTMSRWRVRAIIIGPPFILFVAIALYDIGNSDLQNHHALLKFQAMESVPTKRAHTGTIAGSPIALYLPEASAVPSTSPRPSLEELAHDDDPVIREEAQALLSMLANESAN